MNKLFELHRAIDARVDNIRDNRPDWLCGKGCDNCCRRLAEVPQLTAAEWDLLLEGLVTLPADRLHEISRDMAALSSQSARPLVCPLLEESSGACPVYLQRPIACRTYGFYAQRELGLYCHEIETQVSNGVLADVVWGNHDAIDQQLKVLGESKPLTEWFLSWEHNEQIQKAKQQ
jgi:Fe-S-cluster containining protein